jgi:hypothetical protein
MRFLFEKVLSIFRAIEFQVIIFCVLLIFFCWPFIETYVNLSQYELFCYIYGLWLIMAGFICLISYAFRHNDTGNNKEIE